MKVCQVCAVDFTLDKFLLPLVDGMSLAGWKVTSVCSDGPAIASVRQRGYSVETLPIPRSLNPLRYPLPIWQLYKLFRRERFDIVHTHTPVAALLARIAARLAGIPLVVYTAHGFYFHDEMPRWKRRIFVTVEKLGGSLTDLLFTQSAEDALAAVREGIMPAEHVLAIGNGVDAARFDPSMLPSREEIRSSLGIPPDAFVVGMVGRLVAEKGVSEYLRAALLLAARYPNVFFLLTGERLASDHADPVDAALDSAQAALGSRLKLTGMRSDIPALMRAMDVFCLPSYREGMPRTIIEAMMSGLPVVATNIRGSREEVVEGETGLLVKTRDADALAHALASLVDDPAKMQRMGAAGRARALTCYDESSVVALQLAKIREYAVQRGLAPKNCSSATDLHGCSQTNNTL